MSLNKQIEREKKQKQAVCKVLSVEDFAHVKEKEEKLIGLLNTNIKIRALFNNFLNGMLM